MAIANVLPHNWKNIVPNYTSCINNLDKCALLYTLGCPPLEPRNLHWVCESYGLSYLDNFTLDSMGVKSKLQFIILNLCRIRLNYFSCNNVNQLVFYCKWFVCPLLRQILIFSSWNISNSSNQSFKSNKGIDIFFTKMQSWTYRIIKWPS